MPFNAILKNKTSKIVILSLACVLIITVWYMEKTKKIFQYGMVFYEMGMQCGDKCGQEKSLQYFKKAIHYDPNISGAHYQLALIYEEMGRHAEALEYFRRVTELDYLNILAFYRVGLQHFREGSYELAIRYLLPTDHRMDSSPDMLDYYLARAYDQKKEYRLASQHYLTFVWTHAEYADEIYPRAVEVIRLLNDDEYIITGHLHWLREDSKYNLADQFERAANAVQISDTDKNNL